MSERANGAGLQFRLVEAGGEELLPGFDVRHHLFPGGDPVAGLQCGEDCFMLGQRAAQRFRVRGEAVDAAMQEAVAVDVRAEAGIAAGLGDGAVELRVEVGPAAIPIAR